MSAADGATLQVRVVTRAGRTGLGLVRLRAERSGETSTKLEERSRGEGGTLEERRREAGRGEVLVIRLAAAPVDGAANRALTEFLAQLLHVPRTSVTIVSGERSRNKRVRFAHLSPAQLMERLSAVLPP